MRKIERKILHIDADSYYVSVEMVYHPELRGKAVAVAGDPQARHGIILAKSLPAKKAGVKTGEAIWEAKRKCSDLIILPADFPKYQRFSKMMREIYLEYTDMVEPFSLDECWLDVTGNNLLYKDPVLIAKEIQERVWLELGIPVSIGVSFDKIYSKLGSDQKTEQKSITVYTRKTFKELAWSLPVGELLMVGRSTRNKLESRGVMTIGDLAGVPVETLKSWLGKWGELLYIFANGLDPTPVAQFDELQVIKSIGNSTTTPRDLKTEDDVRVIVYVLAESVARRMRDQGFKGRVISVNVRSSELSSFIRQRKIERYTNITQEIAEEVMRLFHKNYNWSSPIRSIGINVSNFEHDNVPTQIDFFVSEEKRVKLEKIDEAVDNIRRRFGNFVLQRGIVLTDTELSHFNPYEEHTIHPISYLK